MRIRVIAHRWANHRAAANVTTHGTWIIVAAAISLMSIGAIAVPGSPMHHWVTCQIAHVGQIASHSKTTSVCTLDASTSSTSSNISSTSIESVPFFMASTQYGASDPNNASQPIVQWTGTSWQTISPSSGHYNPLASDNYLVTTITSPSGTTSAVIWTNGTWQFINAPSAYTNYLNTMPLNLISPQGYIGASSNGGIVYTKINLADPTSSSWSLLTAPESGSSGLNEPLAINPNNGDFATTEATGEDEPGTTWAEPQSNQFAIVSPENPSQPVLAPTLPSNAATPSGAVNNVITLPSVFDSSNNDLLVAGNDHIWIWNGLSTGSWRSIPLPNLSGLRVTSTFLEVDPVSGMIILIQQFNDGGVTPSTIVSTLSSLSGTPTAASWVNLSPPSGYEWPTFSRPTILENGDLVTFLTAGTSGPASLWTLNLATNKWTSFPANPFIFPSGTSLDPEFTWIGGY